MWHCQHCAGLMYWYSWCDTTVVVCHSLTVCTSVSTRVVGPLLQGQFLLRSSRAAEYCDQPICLSMSLCVCVCVSVCEHISGTAGPILTKFCLQIPCGRGSVLLWWRCTTLCTSGFMDDFMFGRNGRDAETWGCTVQWWPWAAWQYWDGVWCLWMLVFLGNVHPWP